MTLPERFELERSARWLFFAAPWVMAVCALISVTLPVIPGEGTPRNESFLLGFAILGFLGFGLGALYSFRIVRRLPEAAVSVDEDGLWPTIKEKDAALVRWSSVVRLREREIMQRLEALDSSGKVVAKLEYQLQDFQRLRSIVLQRVKLERNQSTVTGVHQKSRWYHFFSIGSMIGFALLGWYVGQTEPLIGYAGMALVVVGIAWEYWTMPFRLVVTPSALEIDRPYQRQRVPRERISRIEVEDELVRHAKLPRVTVHLIDGSESIRLKSLGLQAVELHQILQAWHQGEA